MIGAGVTLEPGDAYAPAFIASPLIYELYNKNLSSSNPNVISVDGETLKALTVGTSNITASAKYRGKTYQDTKETTIKTLEYSLASNRTATGIVLARIPKTIEVGEEFSAQAYILSAITDDHPYPYGYADDNLMIYTSSNPDVCRVKNGVLIGVSTGMATITVSDLTGTVTESCNVEVVEKTTLKYTTDEVTTVNADNYDWSTAETTTLAIINILSDASAAGMKKVIFPEQIYTISPAYGTINIPTQMIVDFSGSVVQIEASGLTESGYQMFLFKSTEYSSIVNAVIYGERDTASGSAACQSVYFSGYNFHSGLKDCTISKSPGFNIGAAYSNMVRIGFKLTAVEAGGIDDSGNNQDEAYAYRHNDYMSITSLGSRFGFGNMQGFQGYTYLGARCYDIFFYDTNKNFLSAMKNCIQYYLYDKPDNAAYARIVFRQSSAPTSSDPDFASIAHLYSYNHPDHCYIQNCIMTDCNDTAIQPNGGESWLFEGCVFRNNGYSDPASHIDWEDGRNHNKGHVLRNCSFEGGGAVTAVGADGLVIHNNVFKDVPLKVRSEVQNSRIWLNQFIGSKAKLTITTKTDMICSQNYGYDGASYTISEVSDVGFAVREAENNFAS